MDAQDEQDFHDFVVGQWHALLRTAYLLTGDREDAEDLVQDRVPTPVPDPWGLETDGSEATTDASPVR